MSRGRTLRGRSRGGRGLLSPPAAKPLLRTEDHGGDVWVDARVVGAQGDRWYQPFLDANWLHLKRLEVTARVEARHGLGLALTPHSRIGAVPLLSPSTRKVIAGLLVAPRFAWSALGGVMGAIGFGVEPTLGGAPLVPGSAREVPAWMLASPVLRRLEALLAHNKRGFVERSEDRESPRGRIDWSAWAQRRVPLGRWTQLPCHFSEPEVDPELMAAVRWTLTRIDDELAPYDGDTAARLLRARVADLQSAVGPGVERRPAPWSVPTGSAWLADALQAMGWVAEERGLGGSRSLDGMTWDLAIEEVWESWVESFVLSLGPRCGMLPLRRGETRRSLNWRTAPGSMRFLVPDTGLRGHDRLIWVDAKYKRHLQLLRQKGWANLGEEVRDAHRADLHQALAYASLDQVGQVDSVLVYPQLIDSSSSPPAVATIAVGRRAVRLILAELPFGFRSVDQRERALTRWRELLAA